MVKKNKNELRLIERTDSTRGNGTEYHARYTLGNILLDVTGHIDENNNLGYLEMLSLKQTKNPLNFPMSKEIMLRNGKIESHAIKGTLGSSWRYDKNKKMSTRTADEFRNVFGSLRKIDSFMRRYPGHFEELFYDENKQTKTTNVGRRCQ